MTPRLVSPTDAKGQRCEWEGTPLPGTPGSEQILISKTTRAGAVDPFDLFMNAAGEERALWVQPEAGFSMVAVGVAARLAGRGAQRFAQVEGARRRLLASAIVEQADGNPVPGPVLMGGFAFDPAGERGPEWDGFSDALLTAPRLLFTSQGESCWVTVNTLASPDGDTPARHDDAAAGVCGGYSEEGDRVDFDENTGATLIEEPAGSHWKSAAAEIANYVRRGDVDKLVLARRVRVRLRQPVDPGEPLRRMAREYPNCTLFAFERGDTCFLGATPERLVRLDRRAGCGREASVRVRVDCLAGSARRGITEEEDRRIGMALLADSKERHEHAVVVRALRDDLQPLCSQLDIGETPRLLHMPNVQHLYTPIEGVLRAHRGALELVERLHPTPAAGGLPREPALRLIRQWEPFDRGWYAGPVGWVDGRGDGEFAVAIRSALIKGRDAFVYAGCGIVAESDPEREYAESCMKLRPMLWALNGNTT